MKRKILVTGAGGGGGENLIESLRQSDLDLHIYGSNMDEYLLAKTKADTAVHLIGATNADYIDCLEHLVKKEGIELVVPNNDTEVGRISSEREKLSCKVFLPPKATVEICQDKLLMHKCFEASGVPQAVYRGLDSLDTIDEFMDAYRAEKYWVRPRRGSGSTGATWIKTASHAKAWVRLWRDLRGFQVNDFIISEFLPGRDFAFQSVWKNGELVVAKKIQRLSYILGRTRLSNMSSSPAVAKTIRDQGVLDVIFKAIKAVAEKPHGNFNLDLKERSDGSACVTEFNIGRFCMITPIFDLTGKYNTAEMHVRSALDLPIDITDPIDIEEDVFLIRELDTLPTIIRQRDLQNAVETAKAVSSK